MEKISLEILKKEINVMLERQIITGRSLLDRFCVIDESSRKSAAYIDSRYAPFYYHLGKCIKPKTMLEIGFDLGLLSASFLTSCSSVEEFFGFKETARGEFFSNKLGIKNIKKSCKNKKLFYHGNMFDDEFDKTIKSKKWDLILINEEKDYDKSLQYLETAWESLNENGFIIVEYLNHHKPSKEAVYDFCENKELKIIEFKTRYGTGIIINEI